MFGSNRARYFVAGTGMRWKWARSSVTRAGAATTRSAPWSISAGASKSANSQPESEESLSGLEMFSRYKMRGTSVSLVSAARQVHGWNVAAEGRKAGADAVTE